MTTKEAKEFYLKSDCSYFIMCKNDYSAYVEYKCLELSKEKEEEWKNERLQMLFQELQDTGDYRLFDRLYEVAAEFRNEEKLKFMLNVLNDIQNMNTVQKIAIAETILGKRGLKARSGMVYWACDIGRLDIAVILLERVEQYLNLSNVTDLELERRIRNGRGIYRKISAEVK